MPYGAGWFSGYSPFARNTEVTGLPVLGPVLTPHQDVLIHIS